MREPARIKRICGMIEKLWLTSPEQRFGQLLINNGIVADNMKTWLNEDDNLEKHLNYLIEFYNKNNNKSQKKK